MESMVFSALTQQIKLTNRSPEQNAASLPLHLAVAEAIVAGKPEQAGKSMRVLLKDARERLGKALSERWHKAPDGAGCGARRQSRRHRCPERLRFS